MIQHPNANDFQSGIFTAGPAYAWRKQVQRQLGTLLAAGPTANERLTLDEWRAVKEQWRQFVNNIARNLLEREREPFEVRLVGEHAMRGFRLQKLVFDSAPGMQVGLNLFLPEGPGPYVPVLCPCGHGPKWQGDHQVPPQVLARHGFAAALFDMPMFGEKARGNDHWIQGAQLAMIGRWSNEFFLRDALRVADYLETRADISFARGMGVTGVSGGGHATLCLAALDPRVRAIAPVCCTASLGAFVVQELYSACPESFMFGKMLLGFDDDDWLCLAAPLPCLVLSGGQDSNTSPTVAGYSVGKAKRIYTLEGVAERLEWHVEEVPHVYTAGMAERTAAWFRRWLEVDTPIYTDSPVELLSQEALDCGTRETTESMLDVLHREVARLRETRTPAISPADLSALLHLAGGSEPPLVTDSPPVVWGYTGLRHRRIRSADGVEMPAIEIPCQSAPAGSLLCFTEDEPQLPLRQVGGLFGMRRRQLSASLRGFGALTPAPSDYDILSWCSVDQALAQLLEQCGQTALGAQTADALCVLDLAVAEEPAGNLVVYGRGEAALPALFAGILHPRVAQIIHDRGIASFALLATAPRPSHKRYSLLPGVLTYFDLPELLAGHPEKRFLLLDPCDAEKKALDKEAALALYGATGAHVTVHLETHGMPVVNTVREWLE